VFPYSVILSEVEGSLTMPERFPLVFETGRAIHRERGE